MLISFDLLPKELLSSLVFEACRSCGDLVGVCGFNSVFERNACDDFGEVGLAGPKLHIWAFVGTFREQITPQHSVDTASHLRQGT